MADWTSELDDPQAAATQRTVAPLDALGIDPDYALTNRAQVLAQVNQSPLQRMAQAYRAGDPGAQQTPMQPMLGRVAAASPAPAADSTRGNLASLGTPPRPPVRNTSYTMPASGPAAMPARPADSPLTPAVPPASYTRVPLSASVDSMRPKVPVNGSATSSPSVTTNADIKSPASPEMGSVGESLMNYGQMGLKDQQQAIEDARKEDQAIPTVDTESQALEQQRAEDAAARPEAYDPQTGKRVAQYKPGLGTEILRGVEAGALGLATGGIRGAIEGGVKPETMGVAGYGDPNSQYGRDVEANTRTVASDDQQLQDAQQRFKAAQDARKARATEFRAGATAAKDIVTGADGMMTANTNAQVKPQEAFNNSPEAKAMENASKPPQTYEEMVYDAQTNPDPVKRAQSAQAAAQIQKEEVRRFQATAPRGSAGVGGGFGGSGNGVTGADFLKTLPAGIASQVQAIGEGREAPPNSRSKQAMALMSAVTQAYPDFDSTKYPAYQAFRKDVGSGKIGAGINSFNTALNHLDQLEKNLPNNYKIPVIGGIVNSWKNAAQSQTNPKLKDYETARLAVTQEIGKAYKGGALTQEEANQMMGLINENDSPDVMHEGIKEFRQLLQGKLDAYQRQWESVRPSSAVSSPLEGLVRNPVATGDASGASQNTTAQYQHTATGPDGHKIGWNGNGWVDVKTGKAVN